MANTYGATLEFRNNLGNAQTHARIDLNAGHTLEARLMDLADHTPNLATNVDVADLTAAGIVSVATIAAPTFGSVATGAFAFADTTFTSVTGDVFEYVVFSDADTGVDATSPNFYFTDDSVDLPGTPNGADWVASVASYLFSVGA